MPNLEDYSFLINNKVILVRFGGELGIKSKRTRKRMLVYLQNDIRKLISKEYDAKVIRFRGRYLIYSENPHELDKISQLITTFISGVSSVSIALVVESKEDQIIFAGVNEAKTFFTPSSTFAVRARREGNHNFTSLEIASKLGAAILSIGINDLTVDLESPEYTIYVDIRDNLTFIYTKSYKGMDGIPSKTQGVAIALLRPTRNSLIASWLMKKRGIKIIPIFFRTGKSSEKIFFKEIQSHFGQDIEIITIDTFLKENKQKECLCLLCQAICEQLCSNISRQKNIFHVVSPTCFNFNNETITLDALKELEENTSVNILRPIQFGYYGNLNNFNQLDRATCCEYRDKVSMDLCNTFKNSDLNEPLSLTIEKIIQKFFSG